MKTFAARMIVIAAIIGITLGNFAFVPAVVAAGPNLIQNANLNEVDPANTKMPRYWLTGKWGTNTATFTYPSASNDSTSAAKLAVTSYTSGDAKWYFQPVTVAANTSYTFTASYTSTAILGVVAQITSTTNTVSYLDLGTVPASAQYSTINKTFTTPANAAKVSVFVLLNRVGTYTIDNYFLGTTAGGTTTPPQAPTVSITAPANGSTVSGQVAIAANASSAQGVAGVRFLVDSTSLGAEDTVAPYSTSFNSTSVTNGNHTLTAIVRDTIGNTATSTVSVTVNNNSTTTPPVPPQGNNLIENSSLETANPTNAALPDKWQKGGYGTNSTTFTYPGPAGSGSRGASINISAFTSGDAKWFFNDVTVAPNTEYTFSEQYRSTVPTNVTLRYTSTAGAVSYISLGNPVASADWKNTSWTFTTPANAKSLTVFHLIKQVGTLDIDTYSLTTGTTTGTTTPPTGDTTKPTVSFAQLGNGSTASGTLNVLINAADNVGVANVTLSLDGTQVGAVATTAPYAFSIDTTLYSNASHVLKAEAWDAAGNVASTSVSVTFNNTVVDTTAPIVTIVSPMASSTVSGTTTLSVSATDNVGVSMVHIKIDSQDALISSTTPYQTIIDTTSLNNGIHTISAFAVDAAGNIGNATPVNITINNTPPTPPATNLILNPSLETPNAADGTKPENWDNGFWGTNNAVFSYPVSGTDGARAARITITSHTDGDAKWFFKDVPVTVGGTYTFSEKYKASAPTIVTARFSYADNSFQYRDIVTLPAAADWTSSQTTITIPDNVVGMTLFHLINQVGTLDIDAYSLTTTGTSTQVDPNFFNQGMVSLTFDDGWTSQYTNALPILQAAGLKGGFYIITDEMEGASVANNRIDNPDYEVAAGGTPNRPAQWTRNTSGTNNAVLTYPVTGKSGTKGAEVKITSYTSGEAQWIPADVTVIDGFDYSYQTDYKSTAPTTLVIKYTFNDNTTNTATLATIPAAADWTHYEKVIKMPTNLKSVTIYQSLRGVGTLTTDNTYLYQEHIYMDKTKVKNLFDLGHEVGSHTLTHPHLTTLTSADAKKEIESSRSALTSLGISPVDSFIYPYGDYNDAVKQLVRNGGYNVARTVDRGYNLRSSDKFALQIQQVDQTTTQSQFQTWVDSAKANKTWLILMYHQIEDGSTDPLGVSPALLQGMVNYLVAQNVPVVTLDQGLAQMLP